jgi:hypothetical protein
MILLGGLSFLIQILCILHVLRTGRQQIWIWIILIGSLLGCTAYFAFEVMPEMFGPGSPRARTVQRAKAADPLRRLKAAEAALSQVETAANHVEAGDAMIDMAGFKGAAEHYRKALDCLRGPDARIEKKLADALFEGGEAKEALAVVERQPVPTAVGEADRLGLLRARIFEQLGRSDEALALYADVSTRLPGEEARCRYAALLLKLGKRSEAAAVLEDIAKRYRAAGKAAQSDEMHLWALRELEGLRA